MEKKVCFLICEIGEDGSESRKNADKVERMVARAVGQKYEVVRADKIYDPGIITIDIINKLASADLVVADLGGYNPNVFYELAIRHVVGLPVIQLMPAGNKLPFDVGNWRTIFYDLSDVEIYDAAITTIEEYVLSIEKARSTTPLDIIMKYFQAFQVSKRHDQAWLLDMADNFSGMMVGDYQISKYCGNYYAYRYSPWALAQRKYKAPIVKTLVNIELRGAHLWITSHGISESPVSGGGIVLPDFIFCILHSADDKTRLDPFFFFTTTSNDIEIIQGADICYDRDRIPNIRTRPFVLCRIPDDSIITEADKKGCAVNISDLEPELRDVLILNETDNMKREFDVDGEKLKLSLLELQKIIP